MTLAPANAEAEWHLDPLKRLATTITTNQRRSHSGSNIGSVSSGVRIIGMRRIRKTWSTIIYRLKNTVIPVIPRYFVTSSIVDNFCKNPTVRIVCSALAESLSSNCALMIPYVNFLPLYVVVMLLAFMLEFYCMLMTCCWSHLHAVIYVKCCGRYLASKRYIIQSLFIPRYFSDTGIPRIPSE